MEGLAQAESYSPSCGFLWGRLTVKYELLKDVVKIRDPPPHTHTQKKWSFGFRPTKPPLRAGPQQKARAFSTQASKHSRAKALEDISALQQRMRHARAAQGLADQRALGTCAWETGGRMVVVSPCWLSHY